MTPSEIELKFKAVKDLTTQKVAKIQRAVFLDISKRVIERTPVDTGRARSGWDAEVDNFATNLNQEVTKERPLGPDQATAKALESALAATGKHVVGQDLCLGNSVEYIQYLNSGSSKQAPAGMTDEVLNEYKTIVETNLGAAS